MKTKKLAILKEEIKESKMPQEAKKILEILGELENFTAQLRKKIMSEFKKK